LVKQTLLFVLPLARQGYNSIANRMMDATIPEHFDFCMHLKIHCCIDDNVKFDSSTLLYHTDILLVVLAALDDDDCKRQIF
jgi:hypothetical protein